MGQFQNFDQFLATSTAPFSIWNYTLNLLLAALLAYLLGLLYNRYGNSLSNRKNFSRNFVLLAIATMIVISIVKSSLALSLGLVGALSIVRFRAAIKEPEELGYLFIVIVIGLGFGANQRIATIIGFVFIALILIGKNILYGRSVNSVQNMILTLTLSNPAKNDMDKIVGILSKHLSRANLKRMDENDEALEASFLVESDSFQEINKAKEELQDQYENLTIRLMDNNILT